MRLLLVTHYYSTHRGGVEIVARELAERLVRGGGVEVEWMASDCDPSPGSLPAEMRCTPARSWNALEKVFKIAFPLWRFGSIRALWRAVGRCDAVHLHESIYVGNVLAYLFARRRGKPVLVTQHVGDIPYNPLARSILWALNRTLGRLVLSGADRVFFISPAVREYFRRFCSFRSEPMFVANGVDSGLFAFADPGRAMELRRSAGRDPRRPLFLFVGRFVPRKGAALVVALARRLQGADWIVAGDGPLRPEDDAPANLMVVRGRSRPDIAALYRMADLLVLPSYGEGFPLVVQEAMACGTPALVSPTTAEGTAETKALLVEPLEAERWQRRLQGLLHDVEGLRASRAAVAQVARERWSWDRAALTYAEALRALGASGRSSASAAP